MRDLVTGDAAGYVTLFLETGSGLHNTGHIMHDSSGIMVDIKVNEHSFPFIDDWDEDGKKDLILGEFEGQPFDSGSVRVYLNNNTNAQPEFKSHTMIRAGGSPIAHSNSVPNVYDLDDDSIKDLIIGNTNGYIYYYRNIGSNAAPLFEAEYETLKTDNDIFIDAYSNSRICFVDWTGDGDLDMLLGGIEGYVWVCENTTVPNYIQENNNLYNAAMFRIINNPARDKLHIEYELTYQCDLEIIIYGIDGRKVKVFKEFSQHPGKHKVVYDLSGINGKELSAGIYFIEFYADTSVYVQKLVLVR